MVARAAAILAVAAAPSSAMELRLRFSALERMLSAQVFTEEGRRYVGDRRTKCNYAYLQDPKVHGEAGRLRIRAKFSGRTALDLLGRCVGLGDDFNLVISAVPQYRDGNIGLSEVQVTSEDKTGFYVRRVCAAIADTLARNFRYPLATEFRRTLEDIGTLPAYPREVTGFTVHDVRISEAEVVLDLAFDLTVK